MTAKPISIPRAQFGWYLRNALMSEARDDLLKALRSHAANIASVRMGEDDDLWEGSDDKKQRPVPAPGSARHTELVQRLTSRLALYTSATPGREPFETNVGYAAEAFGLADLDVEILRLVLRVRRSASLRDFAVEACRTLNDVARTVAALLGVAPSQAEECLAPTSRLLSCGLISYDPEVVDFAFTRHDGLHLPDSLRTAMCSAYVDRDAWAEAVIGRPMTPALDWEDFAHIGEAAEMAARLLDAAAQTRARGIHVMLAGPPGTGKTEFAAALAQRAGLVLHAVGEGRRGKRELDRAERLAALRASHAMLQGRPGVAVLLDEAEDVLESRQAHGEQKADMSKAFVNRMLEMAPVPTIWTSNALHQMDLATIRRMSLIIEVKVPDAPARERIWTRVLAAEGLEVAPEAPKRLAKRWTAPAAAAAIAARTARLAGGGEAGLETALGGIMAVLGRERALADSPEARGGAFDPELTACAEDLDALCAMLAREDAPRDWSLCLSGPPGTGKTNFARHLAKRIGMPVLQKRASDLLSMWVGGSEKQIAGAFAEARANGSLLLIDEAEALLFDRSAAERSFEVSQVDEMLTWMESHPLPLVCTTNLPERMDRAVPRRFTLKLRFEPMDPARAALAFRRMLGLEPPASLPDGLTPGDFAVVRRKAAILGVECDAWRLLRWLEEEAEAKGKSPRPIGFHHAKRPVPELELAVPPRAA